MPDFADQDVRSWAGGAAAGNPTPAAHAEPDGDEGDEGDEGERGAVEILTDLQGATDAVVAELEALDVTDEPQGVKSKLRTLLADLQETQQDTAAMIEAYQAAHEDDEDEETELLGDEPPKKKAAGPPKKGAKKKPGGSPAAEEGDDEEAA